jgi:hypothetical protein
MFVSGRENVVDHDREHTASQLELGFSIKYPSVETVQTASGPLTVRRQVDLDARRDETRISGYFEPPLPEGAHVRAEARGDLATGVGVGRDIERTVGSWMSQHEAVVAAKVQEMGGLAVAASAQ